VGLNLDYLPGATPLDPDEAAGLIPAHIATMGQLNDWEAQNIIQAELWLRGRRRELLSLEFVRLLHKRMFSETWKWAGKFRNTEKSIGIDPAHISPRTQELLEDVKVQLQHKSYPLDELAARFHHRLVSIHPFANGNGRHARLMADLLLEEHGAPRFSWGQNSSANAETVRQQYIAALRAADGKSYQLLFNFVRT
jgi:Fic-DOC domain mobile mystery protein B